MELVVDANILFSLLIASKHSKLADLFFMRELRLSAPEHILEECKEHFLEISGKSGQSVKDLEILLTLLLGKIDLLPFSEFEEYIPRAKQVCPDPGDVEYFAVALKLNFPLWSNDKKLKSQSEVKVFSTSELIPLLS